MKGTKIGLLLVILALGSTVETAWRVRNHVGLGAWRWFFTGGRFHGPSFSFNAEETQAVAADTAIEVENAFGAVKVTQGAPGEARIAVRKVVFLPTEEKARAYAERIRIQARREGGALRISTNRAELERGFGGEPEVGFETHLDVVVPPATVVRVTSEHGAVDVADVARADVSASHDRVSVERVTGPADIQARHGDVRVSFVKGDLKLTNRHGDVTVEDVEGRAILDVRHGSVSATRVGGLAVKGAHGHVSAETVRGDLEVHAQHGEVRAIDVTGRASVETSFDGVTLEKVGGDATARSEHGEIALSDVAGAVDAQASFNDVTLTRIGGPVTVVVRHGGIRALGLEKGARVHGSGDEIVIENFRGPIDVEAERAAVRLVPAGAIAAEVKVNTRHGGIELEVPAGSRVDLRASADEGQISADVPGLDATESSDSRLAGKLDGGGTAVVLTANHGNVRLRRAAAVAEKTQ